MEPFGIIGMSFGIFGLIAFVNLQSLSKELTELKSQLRDSGVLTDAPGPDETT